MNLDGRIARLERDAAAADAAREHELDAAADRMLAGVASGPDVELWSAHFNVPADDVTSSVERVRAMSDDELREYLRSGVLT
jgi:hypothetical protein